jgi:pentatricopeptide repeat protein
MLSQALQIETTVGHLTHPRISACGKSGAWEEAWHLFCTLPTWRLEPNLGVELRLEGGFNMVQPASTVSMDIGKKMKKERSVECEQ